jgi:hypothetical protein
LESFFLLEIIEILRKEMDSWNKKTTVNNVENSILCLMSSRQCQELLGKSGERENHEEEKLDTEAKEYRPLEPPD